MLNQSDRLRGERRRDVHVPPGAVSIAAVLVEDSPEHDSVELYSQPEWQLALRVAASKGLSKSEFLPKFLLYVCEQQLMGNAHQITEQRIGTHIFNRAAEYDPGEDNIVRSYARLLRKRLDEYFASDGRGEALRIVVPRGGYVPSFCANSSSQQTPAQMEIPGTAEDPAPAVQPAATPSIPAPLIRLDAALPPDGHDHAGAISFLRLHWRSSLLAIPTMVVLLLSALWLVHRPARMSKDPSHAIWSQLFQPSRNTLIVAADSGLGILQNLTGHLVGLEEYANGTYLSDAKFPPGLSRENLNDLRRQRYTSVVDLNITTMLTQLPEFAGSRSQIRYARGVTTEDIKNSNVILLGSPHTNPWVELFEDKLNFKLIYTPEVNRSYVRNEHPTGAEQATYRNGDDETAGADGVAGADNRTYGAIAFLPSLDGAGHVLIVQGLNMAATQAAADTLFNPAAMKPILDRARLPNGSLRAFEFLVETSSIGATAPGARIVATRFYPQ